MYELFKLKFSYIISFQKLSVTYSNAKFVATLQPGYIRAETGSTSPAAGPFVMYVAGIYMVYLDFMQNLCLYHFSIGRLWEQSKFLLIRQCHIQPATALPSC